MYRQEDDEDLQSSTLLSTLRWKSNQFVGGNYTRDLFRTFDANKNILLR